MSKLIILISLILIFIIIFGTIVYVILASRTSPPIQHQAYIERTFTSADGATIAYKSVGTGPNVIVIPGTLSVAGDYSYLARELSQHYTVNVLERRGRGHSDPQNEDYSIIKEREDVLALQEQTGAHYLVGHSFGGFVALEAARNNDKFTRVAAYEPGVSIHGSVPTDWVASAQKYMAEGKHLNAFVKFVKGFNPDSAKAPDWLLKFILPLMIKKNERQQKYDLMLTSIREHLESAKLNDTHQNYRQISADVLLIGGSKTEKTFGKIIPALSESIPSVETVTINGLDHFGPDNSGQPKEVAHRLSAFFSANN
ncbi:alpha/beta fold hydrolase [Paenibacillus puerhi]|uniref:alpha/beta fold hydrolase n=1 Tax=Paenibacillus puerhi TaxID=2692622 RepID=UPI00135C13C0|nr:alpha/beta hydrolase [Paenibacillus puerhi]